MVGARWPGSGWDQREDEATGWGSRAGIRGRAMWGERMEVEGDGSSWACLPDRHLLWLPLKQKMFCLPAHSVLPQH